MRRSIALFPALSGGTQIEALRSMYDPLASKIPAHITLVFPFESSLSAEEIAAHAKRAAACLPSFKVSLGQAEIRDDLIWLPVVRGRPQIVTLQKRLYCGPLASHSDCSRRFEPHLTIARAQGKTRESALQAARGLQGPFEAIVDRLIIEVIGTDEHSNVESVIEFQKEPNKAADRMPRTPRRDFGRH